MVEETMHFHMIQTTHLPILFSMLGVCLSRCMFGVILIEVMKFHSDYHHQTLRPYY